MSGVKLYEEKSVRGKQRIDGVMRKNIGAGGGVRGTLFLNVILVVTKRVTQQGPSRTQLPLLYSLPAQHSYDFFLKNAWSRGFQGALATFLSIEDIEDLVFHTILTLHRLEHVGECILSQNCR